MQISGGAGSIGARVRAHQRERTKGILGRISWYFSLNGPSEAGHGDGGREGGDEQEEVDLED